jgi:gluconokinase
LIVVLMGPAGSGKTTIGRALAKSLRWRFVEGDDFHPVANRQAMHAGRPLTDAQRAPWLRALRAEMARLLEAGESAIVACSALRRSYREALSFDATEGRVRFAYLRARPEVLRRRLEARREHFFPAELIDSQLSTLEEPAPDEGVILIDAEQPAERIVGDLREALGR